MTGNRSGYLWWTYLRQVKFMHATAWNFGLIMVENEHFAALDAAPHNGMEAWARWAATILPPRACNSDRARGVVVIGPEDRRGLEGAAREARHDQPSHAGCSLLGDQASSSTLHGKSSSNTK